MKVTLQEFVEKVRAVATQLTSDRKSAEKAVEWHVRLSELSDEMGVSDSESEYLRMFIEHLISDKLSHASIDRIEATVYMMLDLVHDFSKVGKSWNEDEYLVVFDALSESGFLLCQEIISSLPKSIF